MSILSYFGADLTTASVVDQITGQLMEQIITGAIASGSKISEPDLAKRLNVSRSTIREAISRLESIHLVSRKANIGARVIPLSAEGLLEIYQIREALEGLACRLAAERMTSEEIADLEAVVRSNRQSETQTEKTMLEQHRNGDMDFHYLVIQGSRCQHLQHLLCRELYPKISMYRYQFSMGSPRVETGFNEHQFIVDAIRDRDSEMAEMLMRRHIRASRLYIESQLSESYTNGESIQ
ncbi:GntR family transcriptional regulator [Porticoccaceae bacterium LTM1]|nr:GntR family transcriptional regulator [Porticoccaceae bacterium LTM1]